MPFRSLRLAPLAACSTIGIALLAPPALLAACGQITGLSDDYQFDLVESGTAADGALDGSTEAAPGDAGPDVRDGASPDATNSCTAVETAAATQRLGAYGGTPACKACLAPACCDDVAACADDGECSRVLGCKLDCTARPSPDRQQCFERCNNVGGPVPALYTSGMGACAIAACKQTCAFQ